MHRVFNGLGGGVRDASRTSRGVRRPESGRGLRFDGGRATLLRGLLERTAEGVIWASETAGRGLGDKGRRTTLMAGEDQGELGRNMTCGLIASRNSRRGLAH